MVSSVASTTYQEEKIKVEVNTQKDQFYSIQLVTVSTTIIVASELVNSIIQSEQILYSDLLLLKNNSQI